MRVDRLCHRSQDSPPSMGRFATVDLSSVSHGKREGLRLGEKLNKGHCPFCVRNAPFGHNHAHARCNTPSPLGLSRQSAQGALRPALIPIALVPSPCDCLRCVTARPVAGARDAGASSGVLRSRSPVDEVQRLTESFRLGFTLGRAGFAAWAFAA